MADEDAIETDLTGPDLLSNPLLNKGTAFTETERDAFGLHGFLPPHIGTLEEQIRRRMDALHASNPISSATSSCVACRTPTRRCSTRLVTRNLAGDAADRLHADRRRGLPALQPDPGRSRAACS